MAYLISFVLVSILTTAVIASLRRKKARKIFIKAARAATNFGKTDLEMGGQMTMVLHPCKSLKIQYCKFNMIGKSQIVAIEHNSKEVFKVSYYPNDNTWSYKKLHFGRWARTFLKRSSS
jgi:hypothetical protein